MTTVTLPFLAPDPALPARDLLLESGWMRERVTELLTVPSGVEQVQRIKAKYRLGESLRVLYRVRIGGDDHPIAARMFAGGKAERIYADALCQAVPSGPFRPVGLDEASGVVLWVYPNDRRIHRLPALSRPRTEVALPGGHRWVASRLVSYAPERAATAACLDAEGRVLAYAKVFASNEGGRSRWIHELLGRAAGDRPRLQLPQALGYFEDDHLLLVQALPGRAVGLLRPEERIGAFRLLGRAVGDLHTLPVELDRRFTRFDLGRLAQAGRLIDQARPDLGRAASKLADRLIAAPPSPEPHVCLHGDLNSRNWLMQGHRIGLIDLDQVGLGPAAADLAGVLAGLLYREACGLWSPEEVAQLGVAFREGYASIRPLPDPGSLRWHLAAAVLVERALRSVTRLRQDGLAGLDRMLSAADLALTGEGP